MLTAVKTMLDLQDKINTKVHPDWRSQGFEWYRAAWIECAELMDHAGYKWWKRAEPDLEQIQLEVVDIWHFGLSSLLVDVPDKSALALSIVDALNTAPRQTPTLLEAAERLAEACLKNRSFVVPPFLDLARASDLPFQQLYRMYVGKNVLNFFRQDHGYKTGTYVKVWDGREDNEHLSDLLMRLDETDADFADAVYRGLSDAYPA